MPSTKKFYDIVLAKPGHLQEVLNITRKHFYREEAISKSLLSNFALGDAEMKHVDKHFDEFTKSAFASSPSIVAVHRDTCRVVGALVTVLNVNPKTGSSHDGLATKFATNNSIPRLANTYYKYFARIKNEARLFERYPNAKNMLEFDTMVIDKNHRKVGLGTDLFKAGLKIARESEISLIFGFSTSIYTRRIGEFFGLKTIMEIDMSEYEDDHGVKVLKNTGPHNVAVMVLELQ